MNDKINLILATDSYCEIGRGNRLQLGPGIRPAPCVY